MTSAHRWASLFAVAAFLFAGCVSTPAAVNEGTGSNAPSPNSTTIVDYLGVISGRVVTDELQPIAGVTVGLVETNAVATTDEGGAFSFAELDPGKYRLIFDRLGYEQAARRVDVRGGETTTVEVILKPIGVGKEPYQRAMQRIGFIALDNIYLSYYITHYGVYVNHSALEVLRCHPCQFVLHIEPGPQHAMAQVSWTPSGNPVLNNEVSIWYRRNWTDQDSGTAVANAYLLNKAGFTWSEAGVKSLKPVSKLKLFLLGGFLTVNAQHRVEIWTSFSYHGDFPDDYTALPP